MHWLYDKSSNEKIVLYCASGVPRNFVPVRFQQIQLRTEDIQKGDLRVVAP